MQQKMIRGNGHYDEFGPSGNYLESIAAELDREFGSSRLIILFLDRQDAVELAGRLNAA